MLRQRPNLAPRGVLCSLLVSLVCTLCIVQWAENFICDEVAGEELWEEMVAAARMLANSTEAEVQVCPKKNPAKLNFSQKVDDCWENFPVAHWRRRRVRLSGENFHCIPHPGEVQLLILNSPQNSSQWLWNGNRQKLIPNLNETRLRTSCISNLVPACQT